MLEEAKRLFRLPGAKARYARMRAEAWLAPFFEHESEAMNRLGAAMAVLELADRMDPARAARHRRRAELEELREKGLAPRRGSPPKKAVESRGPMGPRGPFGEG